MLSLKGTVPGKFRVFYFIFLTREIIMQLIKDVIYEHSQGAHNYIKVYQFVVQGKILFQKDEQNLSNLHHITWINSYCFGPESYMYSIEHILFLP